MDGPQLIHWKALKEHLDLRERQRERERMRETFTKDSHFSPRSWDFNLFVIFAS